MPIKAGRHRLGPDNATLVVRTERTGAAAKAGHNLAIEVTAWEATIEAGADPAATTIELRADAGSLRVRAGSGGMQALGDDDKANIGKTIDDEVLKRREIAFHSTQVRSDDDGATLGVAGELTLAGRTAPIAFDVTVAPDGTLGATAVVTQTLWGMKPYSALFGTLKVVDEVQVVLDGRL